MKSKVFRPNLDDVERLSYGKGAKKQRGTGSRHVCHRLNKDERKLYELAKNAGYLTVRGTGYRKERKGSPLCNTFRQRCDALKEICVIIEKRTEQDTVVIDFSTLRVVDDAQFVSLVLEKVFREKYPDLYDAVTLPARGTPINWELVKTKPIWGINERLLTVACDRDVAQSLATAVLKESSNFDDVDVVNEIRLETKERFHIGDIEVDNKIIVEMETTQNCDEPMISTADDNNNCIDWDDI